MRKIIWSDEAKSDYDNNISFLLENWSAAEAQEFVDEVSFILKNLPAMPEMFPSFGYKKIHKGIVCKQISILYRISPDTIELLRFWNNYQDPDKLKGVK